MKPCLMHPELKEDITEIKDDIREIKRDIKSSKRFENRLMGSALTIVALMSIIIFVINKLNII